MTPVADLGGPVSAALEADLRDWVRRQGIVLWLDLDGHYTRFVDRLIDAQNTASLQYEVHAFRGSYLELMMALETVGGGAEMVPLLIHLPGFREDMIAATPMLELYEAGKRYRKALDTLVTEAAAGRVRPEQIAAFKAQPELTLEGADVWLAAQLNDREGGLGAQLRSMKPTAVLDDLLGGGFVSGRIGQPDEQEAVWERLTAWTGLPASWRDATLATSQPRANDVAFVAAS